MVQLDRQLLETLLIQMRRAEGYCRNARPASYLNALDEVSEEPTNFYSGASGYAGATLQSAIQTLESAL
jgi:hypothetical protein